jgi:hypothetical protein
MKDIPAVVESGRIIAGTNRLYLDVKGYGQCDEKGKAVMGIGLKGRARAEPDRPFRTLILPLINDLLPLCRYSDDAEMEADLAALRDYVDGIAPRPRAAIGEEKHG